MAIFKIEHYLSVVGSSCRRFRTLSDIRFDRDSRGGICFQAGSNGVTFKVFLGGDAFAMKCYTKVMDSECERMKAVAGYLNPLNSGYLQKFDLLDREIYLFDDYGNGYYVPVMLSGWVEGRSLRGWLAEKCRTKDRPSISRMADRFAGLGLWLLDQPWAHGDLKPDNIVVTPEERLCLIDYDHAFVPGLEGSFSPGLGTPGFQHPDRNARWYDRHLDDYSIALIATALYALAAFPQWYDETDDDGLLFDPRLTVQQTCPALLRVKACWVDRGETVLYRLARLLASPSPEIPDLIPVLTQAGKRRTKQIPSPGHGPEIYREDGFYGYRIPGGKSLTEAIYDDAGPYSEGLALVRLGKKRYYIDGEGKKQIDASGYDRVESFSEGLAAVRKGRKWGYLEPDGTWGIRPAFENGRPFKEGLAAVEKAGRWGYIDRDGSFVIEPLFDSAFGFREGTAVAGLNGRFGYIDHRGEWLIGPRYTFASGFRNGSAAAEADGKKVYLRKSPEGMIEICD